MHQCTSQRGQKHPGSFYDRYEHMLHKHQSLSRSLRQVVSRFGRKLAIFTGASLRGPSVRIPSTQPRQQLWHPSSRYLRSISRLVYMLVSRALVKGTGLSRGDLADMAKDMREGKARPSALPHVGLGIHLVPRPPGDYH